jgi:hypothetical protein
VTLTGQWPAVQVYLGDGRGERDNNPCERTIRPTAVGKKNWLFFGEAGAGQRSAVVYTILESCRRRGIDPYAYLREVLTRLPSMTNWQIAELTPEAWARSKRLPAMADRNPAASPEPLPSKAAWWHAHQKGKGPRIKDPWPVFLKISSPDESLANENKAQRSTVRSQSELSLPYWEPEKCFRRKLHDPKPTNPGPPKSESTPFPASPNPST